MHVTFSAEAPLIVKELSVPPNGGSCFTIESKDGRMCLFLPGYGAAAVVTARTLAADLLAAADEVEKALTQKVES